VRIVDVDLNNCPTTGAAQRKAVAVLDDLLEQNLRAVISDMIATGADPDAISEFEEFMREENALRRTELLDTVAELYGEESIH